MNKVIRAGVKTKVLMLSATPVNNRFTDLRNQLALAYEGSSENLSKKLNTKRSVEEIFKQANILETDILINSRLKYPELYIRLFKIIFTINRIGL